MKIARHAKILELIENYDIETQDELAQRLCEEGFVVTQATVSRDIREMKLTKIATEKGRQKYAVITGNDTEVDISLNTTMKIFTVVTTIFLPLTLIVGWYGMNLKMPEYGWKYGYLFVGLLSLTCIAGIIIFFKRKKWF